MDKWARARKAAESKIAARAARAARIRVLYEASVRARRAKALALLAEGEPKASKAKKLPRRRTGRSWSA